MNNTPELLRFAIQLFCIATMATMGLGITLDDIRAPFRNRLALIIIVIINNLIIPLLGLVVVALPQGLVALVSPALAEQLTALTGGLQVGFLLLLLASGSLLIPRFAQLVGAAAAFAKGTMVLLVGVSTILTPIVLGALAGLITKEATPPDPINAGSIFLTLLLYQLLPLAFGLLVSMRYPPFTAQLRVLFARLTSLTFLIVVAALLTSGQAMITVLEPLPPVQTILFTSNDLATPDELNSRELTAELRQRFLAQTITLPDPADLIVRTANEKWAVVNPDTTYLVDRLPDVVTPTLGISTTTAVTYAFRITTTESTVKALDSRVISPTIADAFAAQGIVLTADLVLVRAAGAQWALVDDAQTYQIDFKDGQYTVFQESAEPVGLVEGFLGALAALPDIGPAIDFLLQLLKIALPYLFFIAVAAALMTIGYYGGKVVLGLVREPVAASASPPTTTTPNPTEKTPEALAFTAVLRNFSLALIVASEHLVNWQPATGSVDLSTVVTITAFFVVCLLVAGHKATDWKVKDNNQST